MFRVMSRSLDLYRRRHAGRSPRRVTVHKTTEFKPEEIEGAFEAFHLCQEVDLIQVVEDVGWRGVRMGGRGLRGTGNQPAMWPVHRGTLVSLGPYDSLLWSHGDVSGISSRGSYFQGSRGTPRPIKLVRHAGHGTWDHVGRTTLALSKMNWNNDALYDHLPVTMAYAKVLSRVVKRMSGLGKRPYQFRFLHVGCGYTLERWTRETYPEQLVGRVHRARSVPPHGLLVVRVFGPVCRAPGCRKGENRDSAGHRYWACHRPVGGHANSTGVAVENRTPGWVIEDRCR